MYSASFSEKFKFQKRYWPMTNTAKHPAIGDSCTSDKSACKIISDEVIAGRVNE